MVVLPSRRADRSNPPLVTFYHDIEQDVDSEASPAVCRQVVSEFLKLEKKYGVCATYNVVGRLMRDQPDMVEHITEGGHEVAFHSYDHPPQGAPHSYAQQIDLCRDVSDAICGYRSPRSGIDQAAVERLWDKRFLWNAEADAQHEPYFIHQGLVRLPIATDDWPLHRGAVSVEEFVRRFSQSLRRRHYLALGFHDSVTSFAPEARLQAWERLLRIAVDNGAFALTFGEAADLFRRAALSRYYHQHATAWNRGTQTFYRTKRFRELIRAEAGQLDRPVIADLGSGGGVLSRPLADIAAAIHCVDNAPEMLADVTSSGPLQAHLGEVTDSHLPEHSVDLIICARVIEYLFWPDRLADEIKRIGRNGAVYFVTFPASEASAPANAGPPPDRIRRYFTPEEIRRWANRIGPGRLIGVQYVRAEPENPEAEERYRRMESDPPRDASPTDWVCIGTVDGNAPRAQARTISLAHATFRFPSERSERMKRYLRKLGARCPQPVRRIGKRMLNR